MFDAFTTALSALNADVTAIDIVGNNLANLNTVGYKADSVQFYDLMSEQLGGTSSSNSVGTGVSPAQAIKQFTQGSIQTSGGPLDAAISGDGFFVVRDNIGRTLYTRAGDFQLAADGSLLTATGENVQGWMAAGGKVNLGAPMGNIVVPVNGVVPATPTANLSVTANLDARPAVGATGASFSSPVQIVDSQGSTHILTFSFTKTGVNAWSYTVTIPAADLKAGGTTQVATGNLTFDANGNLLTPAAANGSIPLKITGLADGASDMTVNWNLYNGTSALLTQFAQNSGVSGTQQDGFQAGQISKISMGTDGIIIATYSNGQTAPIAQLALASIRNPDSMISVGNNNYQPTIETAAPAVGAADSGGRGQVQGGALETSTVDVAQQFTQLMSFQRSYEAASKAITTTDQMLQTLIALKQ
ncbi:MAG TPA: flagellar hook protein FlgE [Bryobacteraceae bacterium]|nr:flagellar hook protein FlgE [Bryobacteraceae bacterium]